MAVYTAFTYGDPAIVQPYATIPIGSSGGGGGTNVAVSSPALPNGTVGSAYSVTVGAAGGTSPYTFAVTSGSLPAGLSLSSSGVISGTPTTAGSSTVTIQATDSASPTHHTGTATFAISIGAAATGGSSNSGWIA